MSKRASHWPRKRQYWSIRRRQRWEQTMLDAEARDRGYADWAQMWENIGERFAQAMAVGFRERFAEMVASTLGPCPVDWGPPLIKADTDSERSSLEEWVAGVDAALKEVQDARAE